MTLPGIVRVKWLEGQHAVRIPGFETSENGGGGSPGEECEFDSCTKKVTRVWSRKEN
jgi:hypothetical protein